MGVPLSAEAPDRPVADRTDLLHTDERAERDAGDPWVWLVVAIAVALFWLILTSWQPWQLFERAGFSSDFYDEQARSFLRGRLAVRPEVPGPEGFVIDGDTYLYYGPFLSVVRLPLALFGDVFVGRMVRFSMLVALVVLGRWSARLARSADLLVHGDDPTRRRSPWPVALFVGAVLFSPALFAAGWTSVYHETELWAFALAVVAVTLILEWAAGGFRSGRTVWWAAAAVLAATLTRAPIGLGLAFGLGVVGLALAWRSRDRRGEAGRVAIGGGLVPLAAHAAVNVAKFGTLFSVPGDRQRLSLDDPVRAAFFERTGGSFFDLRFLPTTVVQYLRPDTIRFERLVPGIRYGPLARDRGSLAVETITPASSLPVAATLLVVLAVVGTVWLLRRRQVVWLWMVVATALGAVPTFAIGFVANRYLIDMLPPLAVAGAAGVAVASTWDRRRLLVGIGVALVVWGAWVNAALATWTLELKSPGFTELRSDVDAFVFDGGDVGIVDAAVGVPVPRDGIVGLADNCAGVYIAEQGSWVALERLPGVFEATGILPAGGQGDDPGATMRLARTAQWTLDAVVSSAGVELRFDDLAVGDASTLAVVDADLPVDYRVVADPFTGEHVVDVGGTTVFLPGGVTDSAFPSAGIGPVADLAPLRLAPLCATLATRR